MSLTKSKGNMYPWVSHTHSHLAGECPHGCKYCYVQAIARRFGTARYRGALRVVPEEFAVRYGSGKVIFVEHMNDLFANSVPHDIVRRVLDHCQAWPENTYVFQTKNPGRLVDMFLVNEHRLPPTLMIGATIETNRWYPEHMGNAPRPAARKLLMVSAAILLPRHERFITIEPIMDFDLEEMLKIAECKPAFVNIGADSKGSGLPEPSAAKVLELIAGLKAAGIEIRQKRNLERLLP